jgi:pentatricopeptide repeat protein
MLSSKKADSKRPLLNEVGAWTAAITACGKAGRIDTAIRLFDTMQKSFGMYDKEHIFIYMKMSLHGYVLMIPRQL